MQLRRLALGSVSAVLMLGLISPVSMVDTGASAESRNVEVVDNQAGGKSGVAVSRLRVNQRDRTLLAKVRWSRQLLDRKGNQDRFHIRLVSLGGRSSVRILAQLSAVKLPRTDGGMELGFQRIKISLSRRQWSELTDLADVKLSVTQTYRRSQSLGRSAEGYVDNLSVRETDRWISRRMPSTDSGQARDCGDVLIGPDGALRNCDLAGAFLKGMNLKGADLSDADLSGSDLRDTDLRNADMSGVQLEGARIKAALGLTDALGMTVQKVNPDNGEAEGGRLVTIKGTSFPEDVAVTVGGVACTPMTWRDPETLTCLTGAHAVGEVDVVVTQESSGETATGTSLFVYRGSDVKVTNVDPSIGPMIGGPEIIVSGVGFDDSTSLAFGKNECIVVPGSITDQTAKCSLPSSEDPGAVDVVATNSFESASWSGRLADGFEYQKAGPVLDQVQPDEGSRVGGYSVTMKGSGFQSGDTKVTFSAAEGSGPAQECANVNVVTGKLLTCEAPRVDASGDYDITVTNKDGQFFTRGSAFNYRIYDPVLNEITPTVGEVSSEHPTKITITGDGFDPESSINVGNVKCGQVDVQTSKILSCVVVPDATTKSGAADVEIVNSNGATDTLLGAFTFGSFPLLYFPGTDTAMQAVKLDGNEQRAVTAPWGVNFTDMSIVGKSGQDNSELYVSYHQASSSGEPHLRSIQANNSSCQVEAIREGFVAWGWQVKYSLGASNCWRFTSQMAVPKPAPQDDNSNYMYLNVCGDGDPNVVRPNWQVINCLEGGLLDSRYFIYRVPQQGGKEGGERLLQRSGKSGGMAAVGDHLYWIAGDDDGKGPGVWRSSTDGTEIERWRDISLPGVTLDSLFFKDINLRVALQTSPQPADNTKKSVTAASQSGSPVAGDKSNVRLAGSGVRVGPVSARQKRRVLVFSVDWSSALRDLQGRQDQFRVRLTLDADEGAPVTALQAQSKTLGRTQNDVRLGSERVKVAFTKSEWERLKDSEDAVLSVTQLYRRPDSAGRYRRGHADIMDIRQSGRWTTTGHIPANLEGFRDCNARRLGPKSRLRKCDFASAAFQRLNLSGADLQNADLEGADLSGANLSGADLSGANIIGTDFRDARLGGVKGLETPYLYVRKADSISRLMLDNSREEEVIVDDIPAVDREFAPSKNAPSGRNPSQKTAPVTTPPAFAMAGGYVYWISTQEGCAEAWCPGETWVGRARIDGKDLDKKFVKIDAGDPVIAFDESVPSGPRVSSMFPDEGPAVGGTQVSLVGSGFTENMNVTIGGAGCVDIQLGSSSTLTCTTTRAQPGRSDVTAIPDNLQSWSLEKGFNYLAARPRIEDVTPGSGPDYGGTKIKISGENFLPTAVVTVGGEDCSVESVRPNRISCVTGPHEPGVVNVRVTHSDGASSTAREAFKYVKEKRLFWVDSESPESIGSSSVSGKDTKPRLIAPDDFGPNAVVANEDYVYWVDIDLKAIGRSDRDGTNVIRDFVPGVQNPWSLTLDEEFIYWSDWTLQSIGRAKCAQSQVSLCDQPDLDFVKKVGEAEGLAVDDRYIYWGDPGSETIGRAQRGDGSGSGVLLDKDDGVGQVTDVAINSNDLFWSTATKDRVGRINPQGTGNPKFIATSKDPLGVAVDDEYVYWVNESRGAFGRATVAGENVDQDFLSGIVDLPISIALD